MAFANLLFHVFALKAFYKIKDVVIFMSFARLDQLLVSYKISPSCFFGLLLGFSQLFQALRWLVRKQLTLKVREEGTKACIVRFFFEQRLEHVGHFFHA